MEGWGADFPIAREARAKNYDHADFCTIEAAITSFSVKK